jgi:hypothetical protein
MKKTHGPKIIAENIDAGSKVLLYRPLSAHAKRHKMKWIGPYTVVRTNGHVVEIEDTDGVRDFVHRSQVQPAPERKPELGPIPPFIDLRVPIRQTQVDNTPAPKFDAENPPPDMRAPPEPAPVMEMPPTRTPPSPSTSQAALPCPKSQTSSPQTEPLAPTPASDKPAEPPRPPLALTLPSTDAQPPSTPILTHQNAPLDESMNEEIFRTPMSTPTPVTPVQKQPTRDQPPRQVMTRARTRLTENESEDLVRNLSNEFNLREKSKEPPKARKSTTSTTRKPSSKKPPFK